MGYLNATFFAGYASTFFFAWWLRDNAEDGYEDAYKDAINKINQCNKYDILSVTSFLEEPISKVYITDLIQTYCMFDHQIVTLLDTNTSNLSCVHRGQGRVERQLKLN